MPQPIDYATNIRFALEGRVVTMDGNDTVLDRGGQTGRSSTASGF